MRGWTPHKREPGLPALALLACLALTGCSSKKPVAWGTAEGRVLLSGKPVNNGSVVFDSLEMGICRMAELSGDGNFVEKSSDFAGLPVGKYRVAITPLGVSKGDWMPAAPSKGIKATPIPKQYHDAATSGLSAEVKEGKNPPYLFELEP